MKKKGKKYSNSKEPNSLWTDQLMKFFTTNFKGIISRFSQWTNNINSNVADYSKRYPIAARNIAVKVIYYLASLDLLSTTLSLLYSFKYHPEALKSFLPLIKQIIDFPLFKLFSSPEKSFLLSFLVIEFFVIRSVFRVSKVVKFHIVYAFALIMFQGVTVTYWDLLFNRDYIPEVWKWLVLGGFMQPSQIDDLIGFFLLLFSLALFSTLLFLGYLQGRTGKIVHFPRLSWFTDSIAFWVRIKTPTMKLPDRSPYSPDE